MLFVATLASACGMFGVGPPALPAGLQQCIGVAQDQCHDLASQPAKANAKAVAWRVRCTASACDKAAGSAEITITWSDGTTDVSNTTWSSALNEGPEPDPAAS